MSRLGEIPEPQMHQQFGETKFISEFHKGSRWNGCHWRCKDCRKLEAIEKTKDRRLKA